MRILHVIPFFTPSKGGSAQVAYQMARHLGERGHDVTVVASDSGADKSSFATGPFEVVLLPAAIARWGFYVTPALPGWADRNLGHFDVVHMHEVRTFQNAVVRRYSLHYGKRYVISAHGTLPIIVQRRLPKRIYDLVIGKRLIEDAAQFIAVSPFEADQYVDAGVHRNRVRVVLNGIDLREYATLPAKGAFRTRYAIPESVAVILYLGRLHQRKGINNLIDAFATIRKDKPNSMLLIAGPDDGEMEALKTQVGMLQLGDHVRFTGALYDKEKLSAYVDADVLVSPAIHEIFGLVPFEALMCGTPVVVADDSGSGQLISQAKAGYLTRYGDVTGLVNVLERALTHQNETTEMVRSGQAFVRTYLQWPKIAQELEHVYQDHAVAARP